MKDIERKTLIPTRKYTKQISGDYKKDLNILLEFKKELSKELSKEFKAEQEEKNKSTLTFFKRLRVRVRDIKLDSPRAVADYIS